MKKPLPRSTRIDMARMARWAGEFSGYRVTVTEARIDRWLSQFRPSDRDIAARILDSVDFITSEQITASYRSILGSLEGWSVDEALRQGKWRFTAFSASAGESGDTMLHKFRLANNLSNRRFNELFIYKSDLLKEELGADDSVVFVDDLSGSGDQVCKSWPLIEELLPGKPRVYLALVVATASARDRIQDETDIIVMPHYTLGEADNFFSAACKHFTVVEKETIRQYCERADRNKPRGYGDCGLLVVLTHNCPNNSIPILHANHQRWEGLFRRYD